jgi:hypothetical protein
MRRIAPLALIACFQPAHAAIDIVLRYDLDTSNFFMDAQRKAVLDAAAAAFESRIQDTLTAIAPSAGNTYSLGFLHPSSGSSTSFSELPIAANEIVIYVGTRALGGSLGLATSSFSVSGSQAFINNLLSRGQAGALANPKTDFGPWGGSIAFSDSADWSFNASAAAAGKSDFYSVAVHEIGHLLGIGASDSWEAKVTAAGFTGAASVAVFGGTVPLAADDSHWANGTTSPINGLGSFEAALDPSVTIGTRKPLTDLDYAGLSDIGWEITPVPEPATWAMMLAALGLIAAQGMRRRGTGLRLA